MGTQEDQPTEIWIFDIDGVIADPETKIILYPQIIRLLEQQLVKNIPICFNTGRSSEWIQKKIITQFDSSISLTNLFCVCEMGNVILQFGENNQPKVTILTKNLIPIQLSQVIREIISNLYNDSMFVDETKKTILTIEMKDNFPQEKYEFLQKKLSCEIRIILKNYHPKIHLQPSSSNIAIDIKPFDSNKELGAKRIIDWLKSKKINIQNFCFTSFGDSISDIQMSRHFSDLGLDTKFIYVGENNIDNLTNFSTILTKSHFSLGTLEYLSNFRN